MASTEPQVSPVSERTKYRPGGVLKPDEKSETVRVILDEVQKFNDDAFHDVLPDWEKGSEK